MKKSVLVALVAILALVFAGCVRMDLNVEVNKDGTGAYNMVLAYNAQYFQEDQISKGSDEPIKHYDYDGQDWIGYEKSQDFDSWEDLANDLQGLKGAGTDGGSSGVFKTVTIEKKGGLFGTTYVFDAETVPVSSGDSSMGSMDSYVKFNINIKMPGKVVESALENAEINDEGTATIKYSADNSTTVHIETKETGALGIILIIVGILAVVAIVAVVIIVVLKKKSNSTTDSVDGMYTAPVDNTSDPNSGF